MPQASTPQKHNQDHEIALKKIPSVSSFVLLSLMVFTIIQAIGRPFGYGFKIDKPTWYDYVTGITLVAAAGTTISLWSKLKSENIKNHVKNSSILWFGSCALYLTYFRSVAELESWHSLGLVYTVGMSYVLYVIYRHMDDPSNTPEDDPDPEGIL